MPGMKDRSEFSSAGQISILAGLEELSAGRVTSTHPAFVVDALRNLWTPDAMEVRHSLGRPDWNVGMTDEFRKGISVVDRKVQGRILEAISYIVATPVSSKGDTVKPLSGELKELWRCRIGDYRLVYRPDEANKQVMLVAFTSRSDAYG
jgi:mRNA interferase RelE/StbE